MFSGFPDGPAGLGLLLLRATVGGSLLAHGVLALGSGAGEPWTAALAGVLIVDGLALATGSLTPAAAALGAALVGARLFAPAPPALAGLASGAGGALVLVMALAVGLIGPGAYSVDARLFGRREIQVPRSPR